MPKFIDIFRDETNRQSYAVNLTPFELFRLNVISEFDKQGMECEKYNKNDNNSNTFFHFKLNEVIMICDKKSVEFAIAAMLDYGIDHDSDKYDTLLTFLKPYENTEFFSTEEVINFFNKHDLHVYFKDKLKNPIKLGVFERLKRFSDF